MDKPARPSRGLVVSSGWTASRPPLAEGGAWRLRPAQGSLAGGIFLAVFALFWNGITWFALFSLWHDEHSAMAIGITLFLSLFVLIGLAVAGAACYLLVKALFSPRVELTIDAPQLTAGKSHAIHWTVTKGQQRLSTLELSLVLREECRYRRGTDTITERHEISRHVLADLSEPAATGRCQVALPADALTSFSATSNQLLWCLRVGGVARGLPDVDDEYAVRVVAPDPAGAALQVTPLPDDGALAGKSALLAVAEAEVPLQPGRARAAVVGMPTASTLRLHWATSGKGDSEGATIAEAALPPGCSAVLLTLPSTPPGWSGTILALNWRLALLVDGTVVREETLSVAAPASSVAG